MNPNYNEDPNSEASIKKRKKWSRGKLMTPQKRAIPFNPYLVCFYHLGLLLFPVFLSLDQIAPVQNGMRQVDNIKKEKVI